MNLFNKHSRSLTLLAILVALSPLGLTHYFKLPAAGLWMWLWIVVWFWFVNSRMGLMERGLWLVASTALIAVYGRFYLMEHELANSVILDSMSQVMLLIGGGVGGNFIAHDLMHDKRMP